MSGVIRQIRACDQAGRVSDFGILNRDWLGRAGSSPAEHYSMISLAQTSQSIAVPRLVLFVRCVIARAARLIGVIRNSRNA
jgi:hypothetical protein